MSRSGAVLLLVAVLILLPLSTACAGDSAVEAKRAAEVRRELAAPFNFPGFEDPETKLDCALTFLHKMCNVSFEINEQAFKDEMVDGIADKAIGKALPKIRNVSLETILRRILARMPAPSGTTFVVRGGIIEITTGRYASPSQWRRPETPTPDGDAPPVIPAPQTSVAFDKRELRDALQEIADATGVNVLVDARAQEKGKTAITASLQNVDVDTVIKLLADMGGLQAVLVDDVFYVTTKENAKTVREDQEKARMKTAEGQKPLQAAPVPSKEDTERLLKERDDEIRRLKEALKGKKPAEPGPKKDQ